MNEINPDRILEPHYTINEIAKAWRMAPSSIRRRFQDRPGVLRFGKSNRRDGKRDYVSYRIPASVAAAVHRELCA